MIWYIKTVYIKKDVFGNNIKETTRIRKYDDKRDRLKLVTVNGKKPLHSHGLMSLQNYIFRNRKAWKYCKIDILTDDDVFLENI